MFANAWNSRLIIIGVDNPFAIVSFSKLINTFAKCDFVVTGLQTACLSVYFTLQDPMRSQMPDSIRWTTLQCCPPVSLPSLPITDVWGFEIPQQYQILNALKPFFIVLNQRLSCILHELYVASCPKNTLHSLSQIIKRYSPKEIDCCLDCEKRVNFSSQWLLDCQNWSPSVLGAIYDGNISLRFRISVTYLT